MTGSTVAAGAVTPYRSTVGTGRDGLPQLVRAEWTKFRSVRGWVAGLVAAALVTAAIGLLSATAGQRICSGRGGVGHGCYDAPLGPGGEAVSDDFSFVHQALTGDGGITVRVDSLSESLTQGDGSAGPAAEAVQVPWAKAGVIVKDGTTAGSAYAAVLVTGGNGVRMQDDFTRDTAGLPGAVSAASPRWLRLLRSGATLTGYDSLDGTHWTELGRTVLAGLPRTVQIGLFTTSPNVVLTSGQSTGGEAGSSLPTQATAGFGTVRLSGAGGSWQATAVGTVDQPLPADQYRQTAAGFTLTGAGDIAPSVPGPSGDGQPVERTLVGAFAGLMAVIVLGTLSVTAEYRCGLIRTTLTAVPRRGRVLAAKAVVIGVAAFTAGLAACAVALPLGLRIMRGNGIDVLPVGTGTELRVVVGTAALIAVTAVLALAVGTLLRRSVGAVLLVVALTVLPYLLATAAVLPAAPSEWLLRLTPAAGFAIQQSIPAYHQVAGGYTPAGGFYPLAPWAGFAVLCGWTAAALALAAHRLCRRDA